jgi:hypothetical protein
MLPITESVLSCMRKLASKSAIILSVFRFFLNFLCVARYDPLSSCLVDFRGRANIASVKNFQLIRSGFTVLPPSHPMYGKDQIERDAAEDFILQLGKVRGLKF